MAKSYEKFIAAKAYSPIYAGIDVDLEDLNPALFDNQRYIVHRALRQGRFAVWSGVGTGKSVIQLSWADEVQKHCNKPIIVFAPLAVSHQLAREANKFGVTANVVTCQDEVTNGINITNYEKLDKFDMSVFCGVVLDESSLLKSQTGKYRTQLINECSHMQFKLACSATPSPNDYMELGNHAEFLSIRTYTEMLAEFFTHDGGNTAKWRLKKHGSNKFWEWLATWAVMFRKPQDIGFDVEGYDLPPLNITYKTTDVLMTPQDGTLFYIPGGSIQDRRAVRKASLVERCTLAADIVNASDEQWLVWCGLNDESDLLAKSINESVEVAGKHSDSHKIQAMLDFQNESTKVLVSKPSICGMGLNFQQSHNMIFVGLSDSFEELYQAIGRQYRFGQTSPVNIIIVHDVKEGNVIANIKRKWNDADAMLDKMVEQMKKQHIRMMGTSKRDTELYERDYNIKLPDWYYKNIEEMSNVYCTPI